MRDFMDSMRETYLVWLFSGVNWLPLPWELTDCVCVPSVCIPCKSNNWAVVRSAWPYFSAQIGLRIRTTDQSHIVMQRKLHSATKKIVKITRRHSQHRMLHSLAIIWLDYGQSAGVCVRYSSPVMNQRS